MIIYDAGTRTGAMVLAALRLYQSSNCLSSDIEDIATNCGKFDELTDDEIDDLCDALNTEGGGVITPQWLPYDDGTDGTRLEASTPAPRAVPATTETAPITSAAVDVGHALFPMVEPRPDAEPRQLEPAVTMAPEAVMLAERTNLRTFAIDVWRGECVWSWEGEAHGYKEAEAMAREELNSDWLEDYPSWDDLREGVDGATLREFPVVMAKRIPAATLTAYRELADGLSDMIEGARLKEADIPDDYKWLVEKLVAIAAIDPKEV